MSVLASAAASAAALVKSLTLKFFLCVGQGAVRRAILSLLDLHLSTFDDFVKTKIHDKRDDFIFDIVNFPFLDGDVPRSTPYDVYISQLIRFA